MTTNPFNPRHVEVALSNRYVLGVEIRTGGQGVVYRAVRIRDDAGGTCGDDVALKLHLDSKQDERVDREIGAVKNLRHPALATLLEDGKITVCGQHVRYIAWGFIPGESLDIRLSRGPLTEQETLRVALDVASAIVALWSKRIVHRDIAPKNIMVRPDGKAVLIDLGVARHLDNPTLTAAGATFGTLGYFSPEQFRAEHALTSASDVFTLGIVMLECLLGHHPTKSDQAALVSPSFSVKALLPSTTITLTDVIARMLQLRAPFRPRLAELQATLHSLLKVR